MDTFVLLFMVISCWCSTSARICRDNEKVVRQGSGKRALCEPCDCNKSGYGFDTKYVRQPGKKGYLECYPCVPCPEGTYRSELEGPTCLRCMLNCSLLNRREKQQCGQNTWGECGDCYSGFTAQTNSQYAYCSEDIKSKMSDDLDMFTAITQRVLDHPISTTFGIDTDGTKHVATDTVGKDIPKNFPYNIIAICVAAATVTFVCMIVCIVRCDRTGSLRQDSHDRGSSRTNASSTALLGKTTSTIASQGNVLEHISPPEPV
ncbi:hypothetical protein MAR_023526 [Mya arenaria]|uniref:TNFR-Cys domain-containing protein n=1 Tax=Mya arenaria TaxID=6604 RepID=A0ABY7DPW0_MYAAR|nr:hypothetical protein MAR_023526 [Mya arenaria]